MPSQYPLEFTLAWIAFLLLWAAKSVISRWERKYSISRAPANQNRSFKPISYVVFFIQLLLIPALFWVQAPLFLNFHESDFWRLIGLLLCFAGLFVYLVSLKHLGQNYSPCFDSHVPFEIVKSGPYRLIRHPTWLAKIFVSVGSVIVAGSVWMLSIPIWILVEFYRTVPAEEAFLTERFPEYAQYREQTRFLIPFLF